MPSEIDIETALERPYYTPRPRPTAIPGAAWNAEPTYCLTVNDEWVSHILGALEVLDQDDTWIGNDDERNAARHQVKEIMAALMQKCEDTMLEERPIRLTELGEVESWDGTDWLLDRSRDPRTYIPIQRPHAEDANMARESSGIAASILETWYLDQLLYVNSIVSDGKADHKRVVADFILDQLNEIGVTDTPFYRVAVNRVVDYWLGQYQKGFMPVTFDASTADTIACQVFPFVSDVSVYMTYADWLTLKNNYLINMGADYDTIGLWVERILVVVGYKGLTNLLLSESAGINVIGDAGGDGTYGNTHFDNTACP